MTNFPRAPKWISRTLCAALCTALPVVKGHAAESAASAGPLTAATATAVETAVDSYTFELDSRNSLLRVGGAPTITTEQGRKGAQKIWDALQKKSIPDAEEAIAIFEKLTPLENLGGDYTAFIWLCKDFIGTLKGEKSHYNAVEEGFKEFLSKDNYENLKQYLVIKYAVADFDPLKMEVPKGLDGKPAIAHKFDVNDPAAFKNRGRELEDFVMFMNPNRDSWESSAAIIRLMNLQKGQKVADIGCGIGFFSLKMAREVGPTGKIFAIDTEEPYTQRVKEFAEKEKLTNIQTVVSLPTDIKVSEKFDVAFIASLYHVIYGWSTEQSRKAFLESIKRSLNPDGRIVIVDNLAANGKELHNQFVDHRLVAAQMYHYGFEVELYAEVSPLRYVLILKPRKVGEHPLVALARNEPGNHNLIDVRTTDSIIHIGSLDSYDITEGGVAAAKMALQAIEKKDRAAAMEAIKMYDSLIPHENFGGEFTAIQWFCEQLIAPPAVQQEMIREPLTNAYFNYLAGDDYDLLKDYIKTKYKLLKPGEISNLSEDPPELPRPSTQGTIPVDPDAPRDAKGNLLPPKPGQKGVIQSPSNAATETDGKAGTNIGPTSGTSAPAQTGTNPAASTPGQKPSETAPADAPRDAKGNLLPPPPKKFFPTTDKKVDGQSGVGTATPSTSTNATSADATGARSTAIRTEEEATNPQVGKTQRTFLEDFILFNNPRRPQWEKTPRIMELMDIKPGMKIADVGCGSGYFTFQFSRLVGPQGKVYSMDIKQPHLDFINEFKAQEKIENVETILADQDDIKLEEKVDMAYMCSLYHIIYGVAPEDGRRSLVNSIKKALKPGGIFVVVDNGPVKDQTLPYHGPYLAKELTISQLEHYGFKFLSYDQIIPQRYMLKFQLVNP